MKKKLLLHVKTIIYHSVFMCLLYVCMHFANVLQWYPIRSLPRCVYPRA